MKTIVVTANSSWFVHNFFRHTLDDLLNAGYRIVVIAPADKYSKKLQALGLEFQALNISRDGGNFVYELLNILLLVRAFRRYRPICVLNFTPKLNIYGALAAKLLRIPTINTVSGMGSLFSEKGLKPFLGRALLKLSQPMASHLVFQNKEDHRTYLKGGYVQKRNSTRVAGIGINIAAFPYNETANPDQFKFILVARMLKNKGVYEFIRAADAVVDHYGNNKSQTAAPKLVFDLLGFFDDPNPQGIPKNALLKRLENSTVKYLGQTDDVFDNVKSHDCVVLPSYYKEGMPQCLLEAASMGKPIITTNTPGCRNTVEHGKTGFLIEPRNVDSLISAMITMVDMSLEKRKKMGQLAHNKAKNEFCHRRITLHYLKLIETLSSSR